MQREADAAMAMGTKDKVKIPIPDIQTKKVLENLGVTFAKEPFNKVLIETFLPQGWKLVQRQRDPRFRSLENEKGKNIATIFLKDTGYDYYGYVSLNEEFFKQK